MWYQKLNFTRTEDENHAFQYVQDNWRLGFPVTNSKELLYDTHKSTSDYHNDDKNDYIILFGERYPKHSRDYQDDGIYVELISHKNLIDPLIVTVYDWSHCSCNEWDDGLSSPNKIYRFSDYINEMKKRASIWPEHYLLSTPLNSDIISNTEDDELYAFREIVLFYHKYIKPKKEQKANMLQVIAEINCLPPTDLLPSGGQKYQEALMHFSKEASN